MILWLDAHISPILAVWIHDTFGVEVLHVRNLDLRQAEDREIFERARAADAILLTKDQDFVELLARLGSPPRVIWITCGNTSNSRLKAIFSETLADALELLERGEALVEISDRV